MPYMVQEKLTFLCEILWTYELTFTRAEHSAQYALITCFQRALHNVHWSMKKTHIFSTEQHQIRWSTNVWCGNGTTMGHYYDVALTSDRCLLLLKNTVRDWYEELTVSPKSCQVCF